LHGAKVKAATMVKSTLLMILHKTDVLKKTLLCFVLIFSISFFSAAQIVRMPLTAMYSRVRAYSSAQNDALSFQGNQASLASIKDFSASVYCERRFMLKELAQYNGGFVFPTANGGFGLAAGYAGSIIFNESQVGLAYGRGMGRINFGVQFNYYQVKLRGYGNATSLNFEAGAICRINEKLNAGFHIYNPTGSRIGKDDEERLPVIYSIGFGYDTSEKFYVGVQLEKVEDQPSGLNASMQYNFAETLFARIGIATGTSSFHFGAGYSIDRFRVDVTACLHRQLGVSPGLMLNYNITKK
jgi:hypothetical protein